MDSDRAQRVALHRRRTAALYGGLERVSRDMGGLFEKIYPWNKSLDEPLRVEIDPRRAFGRPVVKVAQRLRALGVDARVQFDEGFIEDSEDIDRLPVVAARGWAILTEDKRIRRRPLEREAINASGAGAFILAASGLGGDAIAEAIGRAHDLGAFKASDSLRVARARVHWTSEQYHGQAAIDSQGQDPSLRRGLDPDEAGRAEGVPRRLLKGAEG